MDSTDRQVLVTGAGGFIGSHLVETLAREGRRVRALVHYNAAGTRGWLDSLPDEVLSQVEVIASDVRDPWAMRRAVAGVGTVFHLAALISIPYSYAAPDSYIDTNVKGALHILQAARDAEVGRVLIASTSEVYGSAQWVPITESHPLNAQSPYSASKIAADQLALSFHRSFGTPVVIVRPFNTYGPRQSTRAVIPTIIAQIAGGQQAIRLGTLTSTRDFNFVADTVAGFIALAVPEAALGEVIQLGSGYEISIGELARVIARIMDADLEIQSDEARRRPNNSEVERLVADATKARAVAHWRPRFAGEQGLLRGLELTVRWFREPANLARYDPARYRL